LFNLRELIAYRELFGVLAWRAVLVRYKQTVIGVAWALLRPLLTMLILTFVFGHVAKLAGSTPLLVFAGVLPWQLFASGLAACAESVVGNGSMVSKVYFPRLILPISACLTSVIDFVISLAVLAVMMVIYGAAPTWNIAWLPAFVLLAVAAALSLGLWLAALNVRYRDIQHIIPFFVQMGLYVSPVGFSTSEIPERWQTLFSLNPMVSVIDGFRWALLGEGVQLRWEMFSISAGVVLLLLVGGVIYFNRKEDTFADVI
jgi:lipopolysaccharide transport system permease protein